MNIRQRIDKCRYTLEHRKAFKKVEKQLTGKNSFRSVTHDLLKLPLIMVTGKKASSIHRKLSRHHERARTEKDFLEMVIDWECARYTKPDKPLNARDTLYKYYPELEKDILPILLKLNL